MSWLLGYIRPYAGRMSLGLVIKFIGSVMDLLIPYILAHMIDNVVPLGNVSFILLWGVVMVVCSVIAIAGNIIANRMAARVSRDVMQVVRHDLFSKISYLSCRQVDEYSIPSLESRLTSDTYNLHQMIGMMQRMGVRAPILLLGGVIVTATMEPVLTLTLVSLMPFIALVVWRVSKRGIPLYTQVQQAVDRLVRTVRENITGIRVIKALSKTDFEKQRFEADNNNLVGREKKAGITMALTNPMMNLLLNIGLVLVVLVGAYRVNAGATMPGVIIAFMTYFTIILNAMLSITRIFVMYSKGSASAERISRVMQTPQDLGVVQANEDKRNYHIIFDDVSFSYLGRKNNISHISFALKRGETLGIIGATGSGKSTVVQLLMRLYDADSGSIYIDGRNVKSIEPGELYPKFGSVLQSDVLFADTIEQNIDFGRHLTHEQIKRSAKLAQASDFIEAMSDGYEHMLTAKATNLSGGQKQRVLIARALAADPEILIFDDSSSALDYQTDASLRRAIGEHYPNTTTIIIAQRVSSIMHADHILMLDEGREIGYGTHEMLMQTCESYRHIANTQMGDGQHAS